MSRLKHFPAETGPKKISPTVCNVCHSRMSPVMLEKGLMGFECSNCNASSSDGETTYSEQREAKNFSVYPHIGPNTKRNFPYELNARAVYQALLPPREHQMGDAAGESSDSDSSCQSFQSASNKLSDGGAGDKRKEKAADKRIRDPANFNHYLAAWSFKTSEEPLGTPKASGISWFLKAVQNRRFDQLFTLIFLILVLLVIAGSTSEVILADHQLRLLQANCYSEESLTFLLMKLEEVIRRAAALESLFQEKIQLIDRETVEFRNLISPPGFWTSTFRLILGYFY